VSTTIVIAGKGGTGKTTISALLINILSQRGIVLAIDGDPSSNLNLSLGLPLTSTVGGVREEMLTKRDKLSPGIPKQVYLDLKIQESLVESPRIDLLAMGRPEGPGCYCAANNMLRASVDRIAQNYEYVVVDSEAGMEHISRQTTREVDILLVISDVSIKGIITAARMRELIGELRSRVGKIALVVNRVRDALPPEIQGAIAENGLELVSTLPEDPQLAELEIRGAPITDLPQDSPISKGVLEVARGLGLI